VINAFRTTEDLATVLRHRDAALPRRPTKKGDDAMSAPEKRVEKLEAKVERLEGFNSKLKGKIAEMKTKHAGQRSAKSKAGGASTRPRTAAPKRRKSTRSTQSAAASA
jgi:predicted RNase H-like nuclease (RuvC/YqgF family)